MTLAEIKAMFQPGTTWHAATPYPKTSGPRTVLRMESKKIVWTTSHSDRPLYMDLPPQSQVIEAREGFLMWHLFPQLELAIPLTGPRATITLSRQDALPL